MKISLNGHPLAREAHGSLKVIDVVNELQSEIHDSGRIVLRVALDGTTIDGHWRDDFRLQSSVDSIRQLDLAIDEPARLARQMMKDSGEMMTTLLTRTTPIARSFRVGNEVIANNELAEFLDSLKLVLSSLALTTKHVTRFPALDDVRGRMEASAARLLPTLDRIQQAQTIGDGVAIADEIQYELPGQMQTWQNLISEAARVLETETA